MLANMQHETAVILEQAFAQRGISKVNTLINHATVLINAQQDTTGMSDAALEEKLRNLALERQKRIQVNHYLRHYYAICGSTKLLIEAIL